jgi:hypothetical protein
MPPNDDVEKNLAAAKADVLEGRIATVVASAREQGVTEILLQNGWKGIGPWSSWLVKRKNLTDCRGKGLCLYVEMIDDISFPIIPKVVKANVNAIVA